MTQHRHIPARACCCSATPTAQVVIPANVGRSHPSDLWLCGHHFRIHRDALAQQGAAVFLLTGELVSSGQPADDILDCAHTHQTAAS